MENFALSSYENLGVPDLRSARRSPRQTSLEIDSPGLRRAHLLSAKGTRGGGSKRLSEATDASASAPSPGRPGRPPSQVVAVSEPHLTSSIPVDTSDSPAALPAKTITPAQGEPVWTR